MNLIAVDPGLTTGWATYGPGRGIPKWEPRVVETAGPENFMLTLRTAMSRLVSPGVLVMENFVPEPGKTWQPDALHIIGYGRGLCAEFGWTLHLQMRTIKRFSSNDKLKKLGWYTPSKGGHANDALRHLLHYLCHQVRDVEILKALTA